MDERPSGWYDDPDDPDQLRYFDGILWSDHRTPKHKPGLDRARDEFHETPAEQAPTPAIGTTQPWSAPPVQTPAAGGGARQETRTPEGQQLAGWWRRFAGWLIDWVLVSIVGTLCALPWLGSWLSSYNAWVERLLEASRNNQSMPEIPQSVAQMPAAWALSIVIVYAIYDIGLTSWRGRTLGKVITRTSVRQLAQPRPPSINDAALRFLVKGLFAITSVIPGAGFLGTFVLFADGLWPLNNRLRQSLHDKAGRTIVVRGPAQPVSSGDPGAWASAPGSYDGAGGRPEPRGDDPQNPWQGPQR